MTSKTIVKYLIKVNHRNNNFSKSLLVFRLPNNPIKNIKIAPQTLFNKNDTEITSFVSRFYCTINNNQFEFATYEEVKNAPMHPEKLLIDVREPNELIKTGKIPNSINIPLGQISKAFSNEITSKLFSDLYGIQKPNINAEIIFFCHIGKRSQMATDIVAGYGYKNVKNYKGSWLEWAKKEGLHI